MTTAQDASAPRGASLRESAYVFACALALRLAVVAWAASRIPPTADGTFYQTVAERIAHGLGYTWQWPDGVVTYAAHYPVGYPALVGAGYALFGPSPVVAMGLQSLLGALTAWAVHRLLARYGRCAKFGALLVALHPGLVAYTPALMTEGVAAALVVLATFAASRARALTMTRSSARNVAIALLATGALTGLATLVRPQLVILAPVLGWVAARAPLRRRLMLAGIVTGLALVTCAPWTARNCVKMRRCALVSVNGGWNLLIGTHPHAHGGWVPLEVPPECREVFDEAGKDACFGAAARRAIAKNPIGWLSLVPGKLRATFDYCGAAGWYLHQANPAAFDHRAKVALGVVETAFERGLLVLALLATSRPREVRRRRFRSLERGTLALGVACALSPWGYLAHLVLALRLGHLSRRLRYPPLQTLAAALLGSTMLIHAVFFGGGRYQLPVLPFVAAMAALARPPTFIGWPRRRAAS